MNTTTINGISVNNTIVVSSSNYQNSVRKDNYEPFVLRQMRTDLMQNALGGFELLLLKIEQGYIRNKRLVNGKK